MLQKITSVTYEVYCMVISVFFFIMYSLKVSWHLYWISHSGTLVNISYFFWYCFLTLKTDNKNHYLQNMLSFTPWCVVVDCHDRRLTPVMLFLCFHLNYFWTIKKEKYSAEQHWLWQKIKSDILLLFVTVSNNKCYYKSYIANNTLFFNSFFAVYSKLLTNSNWVKFTASCKDKKTFDQVKLVHYSIFNILFSDYTDLPSSLLLHQLWGLPFLFMPFLQVLSFCSLYWSKTLSAYLSHLLLGTSTFPALLEHCTYKTILMLTAPVYLQYLLINLGLYFRFVVMEYYSYLILDSKLRKIYGTKTVIYYVCGLQVLKSGQGIIDDVFLFHSV